MRAALKKPKLILAGLCISLFLFATPVYAETWSAWFQTQFSLKTLFYSGICEIIGCGLGEEPPKQNADGSYTFSPPKLTYTRDSEHLGGILGFTTNSMVAMYQNPPTSSTYYLANLGSEFGVTPAHAQVSGSGSNMIKPVEQLWQVLRNVSYLFFIVIFVAIGFMIMLRQKLNPQTVITVQSALPGLVIGLILVTFSYFIAALMTDFAFFGIQIVAQIFSSVISPGGGVMNAFDPVGLAQKSNITELYSSAMWESWSVAGNYDNYLSTIGSVGNSVNLATTIGVVTAGAVLALTQSPLLIGAGAAVVFLPLLVTLVLLIAFTVQFLKLTFKLLMAYVMILITTALGPIYITFSMVPGKGNMVGMWWKTILGNALVFPAVFGVFLFAGMILKTDQSQWASTPPLFGNVSTLLLQPLIAFVILLGTPAIPDMVKKAVGAADLGAVGTAGIGGFMAGYGIGSGAAKAGYNRTGLKQAIDLRGKYREANRARTLGLDRYNEALTIERSRQAAGNGSAWQRMLNTAVFGFRGPRPGRANRPWVTDQEAQGQQAQPQQATELGGQDQTPDTN